MSIKKSVSIIIPNYNGKHLFEQYLPFTFQAIRNAGVEYEIVIVDDCSKDDSVLYLQQNYPDLKLIQNPENRGFSYTCNRGIEAARMDLILLLNSDVKLSPDYFEHQWKYFKDEATFGVMGRIIDMDGTNIQDAARMPKRSGTKLKTAWFYYLEDNEPAYTFYLSGANALIDAKKLKAIGGFNELFSPFYCEDFELSLRAWRLNWNCYYEHKAICEHELSASTKGYKKPNWVKMVYFRNRYYLHALHLEGLVRLLWFLQITFIDLLPKILTGKLWLWKSYWQYIGHTSEIKQSRQAFAQLMKRYDSTTTIGNVIDRITRSVEGKHVVRVK